MYSEQSSSFANWPTLPIANLAVDESVPLTVLEHIAETNAHDVWGDKITRGVCFPVADETGDVFAYVFPYAIGASCFPDDKQIFATIKRLRHKREADSNLESTETEDCRYGDLASYLQSFGSIYVSATRRGFPVLMVAHSLPSYYAIGELARDRAMEYLGDDNARLEHLYFLGPHEEYFEFASGENRILISGHTLEPQPPEEILIPRPHEPVHPEIQRRLDNAWTQAEKQDLVAIDAHDVSVTHTVKKINHWKLIPVIDYTYWCLPSALTMVLGFWDHYAKGKGTLTGYGRLVDYWLEHTTNGNNVPNVIDDFMDPTTSGWRGGKFQDLINNTNKYRFTYKEVKGEDSNGWAWATLKNEIDSGRPAVWSITGTNIAHSVAAFGYRINGAQKRVIVFDAPNSHTATYQNEYDYNQYSGVQPTRTMVHLLLPNGGTGGDHLVIWTPDGNEKIKTATAYKINWYVWGNAIKQTKLSFSSDGGRNWTTIASNIQNKIGWNAYQWYPKTATKKARIRVEGYTAGGEYIAGDGSEKNFEITLSPTREVEKYQLGWNHKQHAGVVVLLFKGGGFRQIHPLNYANYRSYVDALRCEKPIYYDPNQDLLMSYHEPTGEEE